MRAFTDFWKDTDKNFLEIPGKCLLGGLVYGQKDYKDGNEIFTKDVISVERTKRSKDTFGIPHDLMCAITEDGEKYYFYSNGHNPYMMLLIGGILRSGQLVPSPGFYFDKKYIEDGRFI